MAGSCRVRFPLFPGSFQDAGGGIRRIYESCRGGSCSRSGSPAKVRPPLWTPKPYPPACLSPTRPQTAPTISVSTTFHPPSMDFEPPRLPERPTSAQSERSYESCQYSNCSRSPCSTPRKFDESLQPYEKPRSLSPPGWPYSPKRRTRRGRWWDKDWHIAERYVNYQNPDLQPCGCSQSREVHSRSRTPSPKRSPRAVGLEYHFNRLANAAERAKKSRTPNRERFAGPKWVNSTKLGGFGHRHRYQDWSCGSSHAARFRSPSPTASGRSITPSPISGRSTPAVAARAHAPAKQRPQTPRPQTPGRRQRPQTPRQQGLAVVDPFVNSHGHCHTYNAWSCTPSNRNTPKEQSPPRSRDPTPPPPPQNGGTTTINVSYSPSRDPTPPQDGGGGGGGGGTTTIKVSYPSTPTEDYAHDLKGLRPGRGWGQEQQPNSSDVDSLVAPANQILSHCHHCHYSCPTCGHHGHHGPTLFSTITPPPMFSCGCQEAHNHHHHHHCHCFHHHHC